MQKEFKEKYISKQPYINQKSSSKKGSFSDFIAQISKMKPSDFPLFY